MELTKPVFTKTVNEVVHWTKGTSESRLYLPNIQRSVVWRNNQIINYWDSLLRGYPAGLMMAHQPLANKLRARNTGGAVSEIRECDFQLFDGQQRLTSLLLGLGEGQLKGRLKLWVDFGLKAPDSSDLRFALRISSTGQPFGYKLDSPNEKHPLGTRSAHAEEWFKTYGFSKLHLNEVFSRVIGSDLIDSECAVALLEVIDLFRANEDDEHATATEILLRFPRANREVIIEFTRRH